MLTRLLAAAILVASGIIAWLAVTSVLAARLLQVAIALSVVYVAYLAFRGWQVMVRVLGQAAAGVDVAGASGDDLLFISVIVPARDEALVIAGVVGDLAVQRYPGGEAPPRYEVLVFDDASTDGTAELAMEAASAAGAPAGLVRVERREPGRALATKGAALAAAMPLLQGSVVLALDADSRIGPDFLVRVAAAWRRDPTAGALQVRRDALNAGSSFLTGAQSDEQLMDLASQCGRRDIDGTAELRGNGMAIRREVLDRVGGWSASAITEDLELSTRLAEAGEHVALAPDVVVWEEAVEGLGPLWTQRLRWAEGSMRRLMERGPAFLAGRAPLGRKLDFLAFTGEFVIPPLFATSIVASLLTIPLPARMDWTVPISLFLGYGLGSFLLGVAGLAAVGERGLVLVGRGARGALFLSHWLFVVPAVLLRIAVAPPTRTFTKTPRVGHGA